MQHAQLKKEQMINNQETIKLAEDHAFLAGADWQKEIMMKEAVEGEVQYFGGKQGVPRKFPRMRVTRTIKIPRLQELLTQFKDGDKVRIIVLPKED